MNYLHRINIDRFAKILAKRWLRNPDFPTHELKELNSLVGYSEMLPPDAQEEVCAAIEHAAIDHYCAMQAEKSKASDARKQEEMSQSGGGMPALVNWMNNKK